MVDFIIENGEKPDSLLIRKRLPTITATTNAPPTPSTELLSRTAIFRNWRRKVKFVESATNAADVST